MTTKTLKNTLAILLIVFISMIVNAQEDVKNNDPQKKGCVSGDCESGFGKYILNNSKYYYNYYEGNFKNGERNGKGMLVKNTYSNYDKKFTESLRYVGQFKNGKYHGKGKETVILNEYEGNWKEGKKDGYGVFTVGSGISIHKGNWLNDKKSGKGKETFSSGNSFDGEYKDNEFFKGTYTYEGGQKYIGEFLNAKMDGQGKYYLENGDLYFEGRFKNGKTIKNVIKGTKKLKNGIYDGEMIDGFADGFGSLKIDDGTYTGSFRDDKMHGKGTFIAPNGMKYTGEFKDDAINGQGELTFADGGKIIGKFKAGKKHGYCTEYDESGKIVDKGYFRNGVKTK